jgi:hypothetical protein
MVEYIDALLVSPDLKCSNDFIKNLYELFTDICEYYGRELGPQIARSSATGRLKDSI